MTPMRVESTPGWRASTSQAFAAAQAHADRGCTVALSLDGY